jgi:hypothetical protein
MVSVRVSKTVEVVTSWVGVPAGEEVTWVGVAWPAPEDWISLLEAVFAGPVTVIWMEDEGEDEGTETGMVLIPLDEDPLELGSADGGATGLLDTPALALLDDPESCELGDVEEDADGETGVETGTLEATGTEEGV